MRGVATRKIPVEILVINQSVPAKKTPLFIDTQWRAMYSQSQQVISLCVSSVGIRAVGNAMLPAVIIIQWYGTVHMFDNDEQTWLKPPYYANINKYNTQTVTLSDVSAMTRHMSLYGLKCRPFQMQSIGSQQGGHGTQYMYNKKKSSSGVSWWTVLGLVFSREYVRAA